MLKILCITPVKHLQGVYEELKKQGTVHYYPDITKNNLKKILKKKDYNCLFINPNKQGFRINSEILCGSKIRIINTCSTGTNHLDLDYCKANKITVLSLKNDLKLIKQLPSTSELSFGLMISLIRKINESFDSVKNFNWNYTKYTGRQLSGLTVGVIGYGRLGKIFCKQLLGFNVNIVVVDPYVKKCKYKKMTLLKALPLVDILVLHVHVTKETKKMINNKTLRLMKNNSFIINTSRGELVDEKAIVRRLKQKKLQGYATDVISDEFSDINKSLLIKESKKLPILITPHIGGMTEEGQQKAYMHAVNKLRRFK